MWGVICELPGLGSLRIAGVLVPFRLKLLHGCGDAFLADEDKRVAFGDDQAARTATALESGRDLNAEIDWVVLPWANAVGVGV